MLLFFWPDSDSLFIASACSFAVLGLNDLLRSGFSFCSFAVFGLNVLLRSGFSFCYALGDPAGDPLGDVFSCFCSNVKCLGEFEGFFPLGGLWPPKKDWDPLVLSGLFTLKNEPDFDLLSAGSSDAFFPKRGDALGLTLGYAEFNALGEDGSLVLGETGSF